jgi:hypothetical protein
VKTGIKMTEITVLTPNLGPKNDGANNQQRDIHADARQRDLPSPHGIKNVSETIHATRSHVIGVHKHNIAHGEKGPSPTPGTNRTKICCFSFSFFIRLDFKVANLEKILLLILRSCFDFLFKNFNFSFSASLKIDFVCFFDLLASIAYDPRSHNRKKQPRQPFLNKLEKKFHNSF